MPFVVATYVYASSQGQRAHSARTKMVDDPAGAYLDDIINDQNKYKLIILLTSYSMNLKKMSMKVQACQSLTSLVLRPNMTQTMAKTCSPQYCPNICQILQPACVEGWATDR